MEKSEKFFIFTWKELAVIVLLMLTMMGFFFTLGLHYGKKIHLGGDHSAQTEESEKLEENPEVLPPRESLEEGAQHAKAVAQDTIKESTESELAESHVKMDTHKAVDLPSEKIKPAKHADEAEHSHASGSFLIQLGSYGSKKEAAQKVKVYSKRGVETDIRTATVNHQTRYRVVISGFKSKAAAEQKAKDLKGKHKIESYVVIK